MEIDEYYILHRDSVSCSGLNSLSEILKLEYKKDAGCGLSSVEPLVYFACKTRKIARGTCMMRTVNR